MTVLHFISLCSSTSMYNPANVEFHRETRHSIPTSQCNPLDTSDQPVSCRTIQRRAGRRTRLSSQLPRASVATAATHTHDVDQQPHLPPATAAETTPRPRPRLPRPRRVRVCPLPYYPSLSLSRRDWRTVCAGDEQRPRSAPRPTQTEPAPEKWPDSDASSRVLAGGRCKHRVEGGDISFSSLCLFLASLLDTAVSLFLLLSVTVLHVRSRRLLLLSSQPRLINLTPTTSTPSHHPTPPPPGVRSPRTNAPNPPMFPDVRRAAARRYAVRPVPRDLVPATGASAAQILWVGCSDSWITETAALDVPPRETFVHRNLGSVVSNGDLSSASAIAYCVELLEVSLPSRWAWVGGKDG